MTVEAFALAPLAGRPARVLEVGYGRVELAVALADPRYEVVAIDPEAPERLMFAVSR